MNRQIMTHVVIAATAFWLTATDSAPAQIVQANLRLWLDAGDHNADGVQKLGAGTVWRNKAGTGGTHNATLTYGADGPAPTWAGNGTAASPYAVQFRFRGDFRGGYAVVDNSARGTPLDTRVFTYEVWARRSGVGSNEPAECGALIAHCASQGGGIGGIYYTHKAFPPMAAGDLFDESGEPAVKSPFPQSAGVFTTGGFHHIVLTRGGDGDADSAFYCDGALRGRFKTGSTDAGTDASPLTIGGRLGTSVGSADYCLDCDIAVVRVYSTALTGAEVLRNFSAEAPRFGLAANVGRRASQSRESRHGGALE
jgi:hypothetical protein